jgi:hypothetical protein
MVEATNPLSPGNPGGQAGKETKLELAERE